MQGEHKKFVKTTCLERVVYVDLRICPYFESGKRSSLSGRVNGVTIFEKYKSEVNDLQEGDKVICDFKGVFTCTLSFLDGLLGELKVYLSALKPNVLLQLEHIEGDLQIDVRGLFAYWKEEGKKTPVKKDLSLLLCQDGELQLCGNADAVSRCTFEYLKEGDLSARQLADRENIEINTASNRLVRIFQRGVAYRREIIDTEGKKYIYYIR